MREGLLRVRARVANKGLLRLGELLYGMQQLPGERHARPRRPWGRALQLALFFFLAGGARCDWADAMEGTFALQSKGLAVSNHSRCVASVRALLQTQGIPAAAAELRALNDTALLQLAMEAAVGRVSRWARTSPAQASGAHATRLVLNEEGSLVHVLSPGALQNDVMLCVISALLGALLFFQVAP